MRDRIDEFVACKRMAVVGVSRGGRKFGNLAANELERRGYEVTNEVVDRIFTEAKRVNTVLTDAQIIAIIDDATTDSEQ